MAEASQQAALLELSAESRPLMADGKWRRQKPALPFSVPAALLYRLRFAKALPSRRPVWMQRAKRLSLGWLPRPAQLAA
jgi:hypothetical protein